MGEVDSGEKRGAENKPSDGATSANAQASGVGAASSGERSGAAAQIHRSLKAWRDRDEGESQGVEAEGAEAEGAEGESAESEGAAEEGAGETQAQKVSAKLQGLARKVFLAKKDPEAAKQEEWRKDPAIIAKVAELQLPTSGTIKFVPKVVKKGGELQIDRQAATAAQGNAKGKSGPVDAEGRIWIRNYAHAGYPDHWDVQIDLGADYLNVTLAGELMPKIDHKKNKAEGVVAPRPGSGFGGNKP